MFLFFNRLLPGFFAILLRLTAATNSYAQYEFSAKLTDENNKPVNNAAIGLFKANDSSLQKAIVNDSDGAFRFADLPLTGYYITVSAVGHDDTAIGITTAVLSAGNVMKIVLVTKAKDLKEVMVSSAKPLIERKIDRTIFNVENSVAVIGGDAIDALQKAPGVIVHDDNVSIAGKSTVKIMLNDQLLEIAGEDLIELLKTIAADDISKIEVITNPPAAYDAAGNSGIINIVLKKSRRRGFSGSVRSGYTQSTYATPEVGGSLNYSGERLNFYSSYYAARGAEAAAERMEIDYATQKWTKHNTRKQEIADVSGIAGADYKLTNNTTVGFMYDGAYSQPDFRGNIINPIYNNAGNIDSTIKTNSHTFQHTTRNSVNLNLVYAPGASGRKLTVDADYYSDINNKDRDVVSNTFPRDTALPSLDSHTKSYATQQINVYTLKSDLKLPYKFATLMIGGKLSFIQNNTPASYYNVANNILYPDTSNTDHFIYSENTQALYVNASRELGKWSYQGGLRGEFTETSGISKSYGQANENSYFKLFPTAFISYKENGDNTFSLTYGRRIERPEYWSTNPFRYYSTPYFYQEGNPFLQPSFSNNIELTHAYADLLATSLYFNNTNNGIDKIIEVSNNSNVIVSNYLNYITTYIYGITEAVTLNKLKWLESNSQVTFYHIDAYSSYPGTVPDTRAFSCNFNTDNTIFFNKAKTLMADIGFFYQFPEVEGILRNNTHYRFDIGFKVMTLDKKWIFALNGTDIFRTEQFISNTSVGGIHQYSYSYDDSQGLRVNIYYKFGKNKTEHAKHTGGNEEETKRAK